MIQLRLLRSFCMLATAVLWLENSPTAAAEVIYLKNGDVIHGTVVGVDARQVTLRTAYGNLTIPKVDVLRIDYEGGEAPQGEAGDLPVTQDREAAISGSNRDLPPPKSLQPVVSLDIRGRSFWYAFESPPENPVDLSIRLRLYLGEDYVATLLDSKPDTVDNNSFYNSFTFSPTDSQIMRTAEGVDCRVQEAEDGRVVLRLDLPENHPNGRQVVRMLYQINEGSKSLPRWVDVASRTFSIEVEAGKESYVVIEQNAAGLEYSGFFRRSMKNLESFEVSVLSSELKDFP